MNTLETLWEQPVTLALGEPQGHPISVRYVFNLRITSPVLSPEGG